MIESEAATEISVEEVSSVQVSSTNGILTTELKLNSPKESLSVSETFSSEISSLISNDDIQKMLVLQTEIYSRLHQATQTLTSFNDFSGGVYSNVFKDFERHTRMMKEMRRDLDNIFRKIRALKSRIHSKYPEALTT